MKIEIATSNDLVQCANLLMEIYNNNVLNEGWTQDSSIKICEYYYLKQPDLFFVAKEEGFIAGFTFSYIRPWADGNQLMIEEVSVREEYRRHGIAKSLITALIETAKEKYNITYVNGTTYNDGSGMPFSWYRRIGFKKIGDLFLIEGEANTVLKSLKK